MPKKPVIFEPIGNGFEDVFGVIMKDNNKNYTEKNKFEESNQQVDQDIKALEAHTQILTPLCKLFKERDFKSIPFQELVEKCPEFTENEIEVCLDYWSKHLKYLKVVNSKNDRTIETTPKTRIFVNHVFKDDLI